MADRTENIVLFFRHIATFLPTVGCIARFFAVFIEMQIILISILNVRGHAMTSCACLRFVCEYSMAFVFIVDSYHIKDLICNCYRKHACRIMQFSILCRAQFHGRSKGQDSFKMFAKTSITKQKCSW